MTRPLLHRFFTARRTGILLAVALTAVLGISACSDDTSDSDDTDTASGSDSAAGNDTAAQSDAGSSAADIGPADTGPTKTPCKPYKKPGDYDWGCPVGEKCVWETNGTKCVAAGTKTPGADCASAEECAVGTCVQNSAGKSRCSPYCLSDVQCSKGPCNKLSDSKGKVCDMGGPPPPQCDPIGQSCDKGFACYSTPDGFICKSEGKVAHGQPCNADNECAKGVACVGKVGNSPGICRKICKKGGGEPSCDAAINCASLGGSVGYCDG